MASAAASPAVQWVRPAMRGQLPIADLHIPGRLLKTMRNHPYEIRINTDFEGVMRGCAALTPQRPETWINPAIIEVFCHLHRRGCAHSVECWDGPALIGGVYGLALGAVFFAESMFSRRTNASKIALVHLAARLWRGGFQILDTQFSNPHLEQFGVFETPHEDYKPLLDQACAYSADFTLSGLGQDDILKSYLGMKASLRGTS